MEQVRVLGVIRADLREIFVSETPDGGGRCLVAFITESTCLATPYHLHILDYSGRNVSLLGTQCAAGRFRTGVAGAGALVVVPEPLGAVARDGVRTPVDENALW